MDKNIVAFLRTDTKTVKVRFLVDQRDEYSRTNTKSILGDGSFLTTSNKEYTYITTFDVKKDDIVVVFAAGNIKLCIITEVHDDVQIQPNDDKQYNYIVDVVDFTKYRELFVMNAELQKMLSKSYQSNARRQFRDIVLAGMDDEARNQILSIVEKKV